jgi:hypothetical protein
MSFPQDAAWIVLADVTTGNLNGHNLLEILLCKQISLKISITVLAAWHVESFCYIQISIATFQQGELHNHGLAMNTIKLQMYQLQRLYIDVQTTMILLERFSMDHPRNSNVQHDPDLFQFSSHPQILLIYEPILYYLTHSFTSVFNAT